MNMDGTYINISKEEEESYSDFENRLSLLYKVDYQEMMAMLKERPKPREEKKKPGERKNKQ